MYKLTFDDKPEANTYVKWARQKGYLVEGPYREKLSKKAKKFDLNGKAKKYRYVVMRKRGVGSEGAEPEGIGIGHIGRWRRQELYDLHYTKEDVDKMTSHQAAQIVKRMEVKGESPKGATLEPAVKRKFKEVKAEMVAKGIPMSDANILKTARSYVEGQGAVVTAGRGVGTQLKQKPTIYSTRDKAEHERAVRIGAGHKDVFVRVHHKGDAEGLAGFSVESVLPERKKEPETVTQKSEPKTKETKAAVKALESSLEPPKKRGRPPKVAVVEKREVPSPESMEQAFGGRKSTMGAGKGEWEKVLREKAESIAEEEQKRQRSSRKVIERDVARQKERESRWQQAVDDTVSRRQASGEYTPSQAEIMARAAERAKERKAFEESEKKLKEYEKETKLSKAQIRGKGWQRTMVKEAVAPEKAEEERQKERVGEQAKAERAWEREAKSREKKAKKEAAKQAARQESARKKVTKEYLKRGEAVPAGVSDYVAEKEKLATRKAAEIGEKKVARAERAKQEKKYAEKVTPEEGKWTYEEAQAKAREMAKGEAVEEKKIGPIRFKQAQKRKTYILRGKRPGEYKVVAGTKKELETPTSLKAALAKEKRQYKKRKKLLEKPLREIKRAKKVLRTTSRHAAKTLLRRPSSMIPTRGKHPRIGNVSMEYRTARVATMPLIPKSVAGVYTT